MDQKTKKNSIAGQKQTIERLQTSLEPPIALTNEERVAFDQVVEGLPQDSWDPFRLRLAAQLARLTVLNESLMIRMIEEDVVGINDRGTRVASPLASVTNQNQSQIQSLCRTLGIAASQRGVSQTSTASAKKAEKETKAALDKARKSSFL